MNQVYQILIAIAIVVGSFFLGRSTTPSPIVETITKTDTVTIEKVAPLEVQQTDEYRELYFGLMGDMGQLRDSINGIEPLIKYDTITNTIYVSLPEKKWSFTDDKTYSMDILCPLEPIVDRLDIYQSTIYETKTVRDKTRWGIGVQVGYGFCGTKLSPYVGVGVSYNLITW